VTTADLSPADEKTALRKKIRAARHARSNEERAHAAASIADLALPLLTDCAVVACYVSMPTEPGTSELIDLLRQRKTRILLPRVSGTSLEWIELTDETRFTASSLGMQEPGGNSHADAIAHCDGIVMPALAVSRDGMRLGQGGGFYDRILESLPSHADGGPLRIAVIFDDEILDHVPCEPHDSRVDLGLTPERVLSF